MTAEAIGSDASDHDGKLRFAHGDFSLGRGHCTSHKMDAYRCDR
jgi:hypothetical protein